VKQHRYGSREGHWKFTGQTFGNAWGMKRGSGWLENAHRSRGERICLQMRDPAGPAAARAGSQVGFGRRVGRQTKQPGKVGQGALTGTQVLAGVELYRLADEALCQSCEPGDTKHIFQGPPAGS